MESKIPANRPDWKDVPAWIEVMRPTSRCAWVGSTQDGRRNSLLTRPLFDLPMLTIYDMDDLTVNRPTPQGDNAYEQV